MMVIKDFNGIFANFTARRRLDTLRMSMIIMVKFIRL